MENQIIKEQNQRLLDKLESYISNDADINNMQKNVMKGNVHRMISEKDRRNVIMDTAKEILKDDVYDIFELDSTFVVAKIKNSFSDKEEIPFIFQSINLETKRSFHMVSHDLETQILYTLQWKYDVGSNSDFVYFVNRMLNKTN